jgi:F-type H+-transporting ATPase subunit b
MHLDLWTIALQTINFVILAALLYRFLYRPVLGMIDARKAEVRRQYDDAKTMEDKARANLEAIASAREGMAAEREAALKAAASQAQEAAEARLAEARRQAQALLDSARNTIATERERALDEARGAALELGTEFARRLLSGMPAQLRGEAWIERVETQLNALSKPERESLAKQLANGSTLTVRTAAPLPASVAGTWKSRLRHSLGDSVAISFEVAPELIAGVELHFPDAVLRLSWQSELASLRSEIEAHGNAH